MRRRRALLLLSALGSALILSSGVAWAASSVTFAPAQGGPFTVGTAPTGTTTADFNGDGKKDLAVANSGTDNVSVLLGNGTGSFGAATNFPVGDYPYGIESADFNGDGKKDLAVANQLSDNVSVLLNTGTGSFGAAQNIAVGDTPFGITSLNWNGRVDSHPDLAVTNYNSNTVSVLRGTSTGSFVAAINFPLTKQNAGNHPAGITSASLNNTGASNGDNHPDLAVTNFSGSSNTAGNTISELFGDGLGGVRGENTLGPVGDYPISITSANLNNDSVPDLAVANYSSDNVSVLYLDSSGTNYSTKSFGVGNTPYGITSTDFDNDGKPDLAVANYSSDNVSVLLNTGTASFFNFGAAQNFAAGGAGPSSITSADFNGDGKPDLATSNRFSDNASVLLNTTVADADGDGVPDSTDNCKDTANADQKNTDTDGQGDACDTDDDGDTVLDGSDNCPTNANANQTDTDGDGQGDACDSTPNGPDADSDGVPDSIDNCKDAANANQTDTDGDGIGDACDSTPIGPDADLDGVPDSTDNCPAVANVNQTDTDGDGIGDACDTTDDTTAPTTKAPTHSFTTLSTLGTSTVPVKLTWSATDNTGGSGIASYQLQRSVNGGAYTNIALPSATVTTISPSLAPGTNTYRYRVAATDKAGNVSAWATGPSFKVNAYQESSSAIVDTGTWTTSALSGAYGGSVQSASALGRNATFTVPAGSKNVEWISARGNRGKAQVWLDGVQQDANPSLTGIQPFDLYSSTVQSRKVIFSKAVSATTSHKLEVRVLGQKNASSTSMRVDVDAFVTTS